MTVWRTGLAVWLGLVLPAVAVGPVITFREKPWDQLSDKQFSDWGRLALGIEGKRPWLHGETEHFVIHYTRNGDKIANRCEDFYSEIRDFFGKPPDGLAGRKSQVFAFHGAAEWERFQQAIGRPGVVGITRGHEFFYLATGDDGRFDSKARVQAHEMTHLIFNRFFDEPPPLWLNEGIAEYFGRRQTSTAAEFRAYLSRPARFPLPQLFQATEYPAGEAASDSFYAEAAIVVDFLTRNAERRAVLPKFVAALIGGSDIGQALRLYHFKDLTEFTTAYDRYRKSRF